MAMNSKYAPWEKEMRDLMRDFCIKAPTVEAVITEAKHKFIGKETNKEKYSITWEIFWRKCMA